MAERIVDAAVSNGVNAAHFFLADQHVVYDYVRDRVKDGVHPLTSFAPGAASGFPASFVPQGPDTAIDAALRGKGPFANLLYFFRGPKYMRFRTLPPAQFDPNHARELSLWNLPAPFTSVDAAFNGALNREAHCYFFKGNKYVRYTWATDAVDAGYPKLISNMAAGMPASFAAGIDAAVDGAASFADASYLFKDEEYVRFQWVATGEPRVVGGAKSIQGNWPGLAEMLLAAKAKSQALEWLRVTRERLTALINGTLSAVHIPTMGIALDTHFHVRMTDNVGRIPIISNMFRSIENTLRNSARTFRFRNDAEATADRVPDIPAAYAAPWPPSAATRLNITRNFKTRTELNRVSSLIHEAVHVNDADSATREVHISEWYVSPHLAPVFGMQPIFADIPDFATRYDLMSASNAMHNPASYATFARHIFMDFDFREIAT